MTKRLDPEIKALRAITRALAPLNQAQTQRSLEWVVAQRTGRTWFHLPRLTAGGPKASNTDTSHGKGV